MTENLVLPVRPGQDARAPFLLSVRAVGGQAIAAVGPVTERTARDDLKWYLMNKYRALFTDRLTRGDLEDLQYCLRQQADPKCKNDRQYRKRFVLKMGEYVQEETLRTEIAGIASLVSLMKPEDLREGAE